ncbi:MAG: response regulator [Betaproteobacteria bacterium]
MNTRTILLVEDNADDEFFTCRALRACELPLTLHIARDGAEALDVLFADPGPKLDPDLILLDINMPKVDGIAVAARVRQEARTRLTPIVMLTSSARPEDVLRAFEAGANSYLVKPLDSKRLLEVVIGMAHYWLRDSQLPTRC